MPTPLDTIECHACKGKGTHRTAFADLDTVDQHRLADKLHYAGEEVPMQEQECPFCKGTGEEPIYECEECDGLGYYKGEVYNPNRTCAKCGGQGWYT